MMRNKVTSKKSGEYRYATRLLALEKAKHPHASKEMGPLKACKNLLKSDDWESSKFSLLPKSNSRKSLEKKSTSKDIKNKFSLPSNREKVVIVSKKSSSVRVVKSGLQRCVRGVQRSVSVKKVSYSTSVILSSGEDESDSEDDDEEEDDEDDDFDANDDDEDYDERPRVSTRRKGTVIKHTMSKIKTNYSKNRKPDNRSNKKAKNLRNSKEKPTLGKKKGSLAPRELRPRFPYSSTQEWPTARAHRMASLNALAKVHVMYENEGKPTGEPEENYMIGLLSDDSSSADIKISPRETKSVLSVKEKDSEKSNDSIKNSKNVKVKPAVVKKRRKRKFPGDVEIIDTRMCKRMASLNAQAILAASYVQEKPKKKEKVKKANLKEVSSPDPDVEMKEIIMESSCNLQIIDSEKDESPLNIEGSPQESLSQSGLLNQEKHSSKEKCKASASKSNAGFPQPRLSTDSDNDSNNTHSSAAMSEVTEYTKVTKVQINTTKEMEIKEESKAERQIERILEKDDVAITRMYHYQSNSASQSYSVRMETTYKPVSRSFGSPISAHQRSGPIPTPHVMGAVMPTRQSYYQNRPGILASQSYPVNRGMPLMGMDPHMTRQYGSSAFAMPHHYGPPPPMPYPSNDYGYYQPAGPMIQPTQDQYMIHKPVPYHPQPHSQLHQTHPTGPSSMYSNAGNTTCYMGQHQPHQNLSEVKHSEQTHRDHHPRPNMSAASSSTDSSVALRQGGLSHMSEMHPLRVESHKGSSGEGKYLNSSRNRFLPKSQNFHSYPSPSTSANFGSFQSGTAGAQSSGSLCSSSKKPHMIHDYQHPHYAMPHHSAKAESAPCQGQHSFSRQDKYSLKPDASYSRNHCSTSRNEISGKHDKNLYIWRPPTVIDVESEQESRNTKTYIELDVPKACPREKIVVVDVDREEIKEEAVKKLKPVSISQFSSLPTKPIIQPEIIELDCPKTLTSVPGKNSYGTPISPGPSKEADVMVIEVSKRKEPSALIRRAKLHGKQRTYRDSENRPLVPYSNGKKVNQTAPTTPLHQSNTFQPQVSLPRLVLPKNTDTNIMLHGWYWEGKPTEKLVYITNDDPPFLRLCYSSIRHREGDSIYVGNCVLLKSGASKTDLPYIAKITAMWENPINGEMTMSLLWYYRPEHTEPGRKPYHQDSEVFASKHRDRNSVACIEDKCYVLTYGEYCRYRKHCRMLESTCESPVSVVPPIDEYPRKERLPPSCISPDMVFFCRRVYDFRQKRILKNPF